MTEVKETPWADGERAELVSKLTAAIDADPASEEFKTLFLKVLEAHSEREASLLKALEAAKVLIAQYRNDLRYPVAPDSRDRRIEAIDKFLSDNSSALSIQKDQN